MKLRTLQKFVYDIILQYEYQLLYVDFFTIFGAVKRGSLFLIGMSSPFCSADLQNKARGYQTLLYKTTKQPGSSACLTVRERQLDMLDSHIAKPGNEIVNQLNRRLRRGISRLSARQSVRQTISQSASQDSQSVSQPD